MISYSIYIIIYSQIITFLMFLRYKIDLMIKKIKKEENIDCELNFFINKN